MKRLDRFIDWFVPQGMWIASIVFFTAMPFVYGYIWRERASGVNYWLFGLVAGENFGMWLTNRWRKSYHIGLRLMINREVAVERSIVVDRSGNIAIELELDPPPQNVKPGPRWTVN